MISSIICITSTVNIGKNLTDIILRQYKKVFTLKKKTDFHRLFHYPGRGGEDRTPVCGFGDHHTTIVLHPCGDSYGIRTRE